MVWPQWATKNHAVALTLLPPPQRDREQNQKEKAKLVDWDENNLREWQGEKTITINTDKKNIQHAMFSPPNAWFAPE